MRRAVIASSGDDIGAVDGRNGASESGEDRPGDDAAEQADGKCRAGSSFRGTIGTLRSLDETTKEYEETQRSRLGPAQRVPGRLARPTRRPTPQQRSDARLVRGPADALRNSRADQGFERKLRNQLARVNAVSQP